MTLIRGLVLLVSCVLGSGCAPKTTSPAVPGLAEFLARIEATEQRREPFRVFDDLYYVGLEWVSVWLWVTDDGLVLIDTAYGDYVDHVLASIRKLGFDPADIRWLLCTHAHFDHAGGAARLQELTGARLVMAEGDWALLESGAASAGFAFPDVPRDRVARDGELLQLGNRQMRFLITPGHTPGVLSLEFEVHDGDASYLALTFGGVGLNFSGVEASRAYVGSVRRLLGRAGVSVHVPNHPFQGQVFERAARLEGRAAGEPHPFVDAEGLREVLEELLVQGEAKLADEREAAAAQPSPSRSPK